MKIECVYSTIGGLRRELRTFVFRERRHVDKSDHYCVYRRECNLSLFEIVSRDIVLNAFVVGMDPKKCLGKFL